MSQEHMKIPAINNLIKGNGVRCYAVLRGTNYHHGVDAAPKLLNIQKSDLRTMLGQMKKESGKEVEISVQVIKRDDEPDMIIFL